MSIPNSRKAIGAAFQTTGEAIPGNEEVLKLIDSAVFVLCLDDHDVSSIADVTRTFLHGDGRNR